MRSSRERAYARADQTSACLPAEMLVADDFSAFSCLANGAELIDIYAGLEKRSMCRLAFSLRLAGRLKERCNKIMSLVALIAVTQKVDQR